MKNVIISKQRVGLIFFLLSLLYVIILCNLFFIQLYNYHFYEDLAQQQYHTVLKTSPLRAIIYDRNDKSLVSNKECLSAFIMPRKLKNRNALLPFLTTYFPRAAQQLINNPQQSFLFVKRRLTDDEQVLIDQSGMKDIYYIQEYQRFYPFSCCASLVGITDIDNQGALGIEYMYNDRLQGEPTTYLLQKDARVGYFYLKKEIQSQGAEGISVSLTIDAELQFLAARELKNAIEKNNATKGSIIIMDPFSGDILAAPSYPTFDPNDRELLIIENTKNNGFVECYEPGSVMKIFIALAALDEKITTLEEMIDCKNSTTAYVDGRQVNTWKAFGVLPFKDVIAYSNNIGIALIAQRLGQRIFDHYKRLGFGTKVSIPFAGQPSGFVNPPAQWSKQSAISLSYGYEITTTLLQLARALSVLCNGGFLIEPRLTLDTPIKKTGPLYRPYDLHSIQTILKNTVDYGTTKCASLKGYDILAKTGSASTLVNGQYTDEIGNYTCAGIIRKGSYQRILVVHMHVPNTRKKYAATIAAPLFKKVAEKLVIHDQIM